MSDQFNIEEVGYEWNVFENKYLLKLSLPFNDFILIYIRAISNNMLKAILISHINLALNSGQYSLSEILTEPLLAEVTP